MIEKRISVRKPVMIPAKIALFEEGEGYENSLQMEGNISDVTISGVGLEVKTRSTEAWEKLKDFSSHKGIVFLLRLKIPPYEKKFAVDCTMAWCFVTGLEEKELRMGVYLNQMDTQNHEEWYRFVEKY